MNKVNGFLDSFLDALETDPIVVFIVTAELTGLALGLNLLALWLLTI